MTRDEAEQVLRVLGAAEGEDFSLFEAAIACALHEDPKRDPHGLRSGATEAAARLKARLERGESPEEALAETMAGDLRLAGDLTTYDHPDNADILAVWERRKGPARGPGRALSGHRSPLRSGHQRGRFPRPLPAAH